MSPLQPLAVLFLAGRLYAQRAHHSVRGGSLFEDHEYLGEVYEAYDAAFDTLVERSIGLKQPIDETAVIKAAVKELDDFRDTTDPAIIFRVILGMESDICTEIAKLKGLTPGTMNLVQGMADESEARQYKLRQRTV